MEKHGITAPPKVMWAVDDEIRGKVKALKCLLADSRPDPAAIKETHAAVTAQVKDMIFKEEEIMLPMVSDKFSLDEWQAIEAGSHEIGFPFFPEGVGRWQPSGLKLAGAATDSVDSTMSITSEIAFDAGTLSAEEANSIFNVLPLDMTFVDADDRVKYFTQGKERIFDRPKTILGREVRRCHPPASVHIVETIIASFRSGEKDHEAFWIPFGDKFVHIRYFAVRNRQGQYLGTLEVTQDVKPLTTLTGEKRLL